MTPATGTLDYVASTTRIHSSRRHGARRWIRTPAALLSMSVALAGCTSQLLAPDARTNPKSEDAVSGTAWSGPGSSSTGETTRDGRNPLPAVGERLPAPMESTGTVVLDDDPVKMPPKPRPAEDAASGRDTWTRIRAGLSLPRTMNSRVRRQIEWYGKNPGYLHRLARRARPYLAYIVREVEQRGLPLEFALLPAVESAFQERARSPAGAAGLWQFIPSTGKMYGLKQNWWYDGRRDVVASTRAALDYLTKLLGEFGGDPLLAAAAYNWGEGNVGRAISRNRARGRPTDVWSLRLPRETRTHVSRLLAIAAIVEKPDRYGVVLEPIPDRVHFRQVRLDGQIDLGAAADLAGIPLAELRRLNPGFKRGITDPGGPHRLQLPRAAAERFTAKLAEVPTAKLVRWNHHEIVRGDTLGTIARRYGTSIAALKDVNGLASDRIRAGSRLMVPAPTGTLHASRSGGRSQVRLDRAAADRSGKSTHRVRRGDSLWRISRRHGVSMEQIAAWNGLSMTTVLRPGLRLTVYRRNTDPSPIRSPRPLTSASRKASGATVVHVVEHGDTLSAIAKRHGTTVLDLAEFNRIEESTILRPGQELRLIPAAYSKTPRDRERIRYRVERGDSLWEISRRFGVSVASLRKWNHLPKGRPLMPGRELDVHPMRTPAI